MIGIGRYFEPTLLLLLRVLLLVLNDGSPTAIPEHNFDRWQLLPANLCIVEDVTAALCAGELAFAALQYWRCGGVLDDRSGDVFSIDNAIVIQ